MCVDAGADACATAPALSPHTSCCVATINNQPVTITGFNPGDIIWAYGQAANLLLTPREAHRECGQHAALTATALDASGKPVVGVPILFTAYGWVGGYGWVSVVVWV